MIETVLVALALVAGAADAPAVDRPRHLRLPDGRPMFLAGPGDPEDFLYRGERSADGTRRGDQMAIIEKLGKTGANCLYIEAVRSHGGDGDRTHNPFVDYDPARRLDGRILDQWEEWFRAMDDRGIAIFFIIYDDDARIWDTKDTVGPDEARFLGQLVERFRRHPLLIWCVAEEYAEALSAARVRAIAAEIRKTDPQHPIAVHKNHGIDFAEFAADPNIDQFAIQWNVKTAAELHDGVVRAHREAAGRYSLNLAEAADFGSGETARKKSWAIAMGGAQVMILGMDVASTPVSDLEDCGRLAKFMELADWTRLAPHDELRLGGTERVLALPGARAIVYSSSLTADLGFKGLAAGRYRLRWLDCASGAAVLELRFVVSEGDQIFPAPAGLGREIALLIERESGDGSPSAALPPPQFPGVAWQVRTPAELGLDAAKLEALKAAIGGSGCVVRRGYLVYTWGDFKKRSDVASAAKPFYTHFLFRAIEEGKVGSVDDPVNVFEPGLNHLNPDRGYKDRGIRWKDLACQTSGYGVEERPGEAFDYSDFNIALFFDTLFHKVYGVEDENVDARVLHPLLTDVLQCEDQPTFMVFGSNRPGRVGISPRDFARFGLLYLNGGRWGERRILRPESVAAIVGSSLPGSIPRTTGKAAQMMDGQRSIGGGNNQTDHLGSYSFAWWTNGVDRDGARHWPDAPAEAFGAFGHGGIRAMVVFPGLDLIVSWNETGIDERKKENRALQLLLDAVTGR